MRRTNPLKNSKCPRHRPSTASTRFHRARLPPFDTLTRIGAAKPLSIAAPPCGALQARLRPARLVGRGSLDADQLRSGSITLASRSGPCRSGAEGCMPRLKD